MSQPIRATIVGYRSVSVSGIGCFEVRHDDGTTHCHWVDNRVTVGALAAAFPGCLSDSGKIKARALEGMEIYYWTDATFTMERFIPAEEYDAPLAAHEPADEEEPPAERLALLAGEG
jgi:hypothetical protein